METYVEDRIRAKLPTMDPEKRQKAEKFLREQARYRASKDRADAAWAAYEATPRWRFLKRRRLLRAACFASAGSFAAVGDDKSAQLMLSRA